MQSFRMCMIMQDLPVLPLEASSITWYPTKKVNERKVTLNGELPGQT